jgi:hypothetical protein
MSLLNEDLLVSLVDDFLTPFGCDSDLDNDFSYDSKDDRVYFSIIVSERSDRLFKQYILNEFHFDVPNIFMISLLHEVGHAQTLWNFSQKQIQSAHRVKKALEKKLEKNNSDEIYSQYFDLSIEKAATAWAVDYYKNNKTRCDEFYSLFEKTLHEEFKRIGLTE